MAEAEGREYVPPAPAPEPELRPEPLPDPEFWAKLDQIVRDSQRDREPEPEAGTDDEATREAEAGRIPEPEREVIQPQSEADWLLQYRARHPEMFGPERYLQDMAEIREDLQHIGRQIDELAARGAEADARRAEARREMFNEPAAWKQAQAQVEADLEPSWQAGEAVREAAADMEAEI